MKIDNTKEWTAFLTELGQRYGVTIQLARVFGKRWSYIAGPTDSEAGLMGQTRIELDDGYGVIVFASSPSFDPSAIISAICKHAASA